MPRTGRSVEGWTWCAEKAFKRFLSRSRLHPRKKSRPGRSALRCLINLCSRRLRARPHAFAGGMATFSNCASTDLLGRRRRLFGHVGLELLELLHQIVVLLDDLVVFFDHVIAFLGELL